MKNNKQVTLKTCFYLELKGDKKHPKLIKTCRQVAGTSPGSDFKWDLWCPFQVSY